MENMASEIAKLTGEALALGAAISVLIRVHPERDRVAAQLHEDLERMHAALLTKLVPDETIRGLEVIRDQFFLRQTTDPGQTQAR